MPDINVERPRRLANLAARQRPALPPVAGRRRLRTQQAPAAAPVALTVGDVRRLLATHQDLADDAPFEALLAEPTAQTAQVVETQSETGEVRTAVVQHDDTPPLSPEEALRRGLEEMEARRRAVEPKGPGPTAW